MNLETLSVSETAGLFASEQPSIAAATLDLPSLVHPRGAIVMVADAGHVYTQSIAAEVPAAEQSNTVDCVYPLPFSIAWSRQLRDDVQLSWRRGAFLHPTHTPSGLEGAYDVTLPLSDGIALLQRLEVDVFVRLDSDPRATNKPTRGADVVADEQVLILKQLTADGMCATVAKRFWESMGKGEASRSRPDE